MKIEGIEVDYLPANRSFLGGSENDLGVRKSDEPNTAISRIPLTDQPPLFNIPSAGPDD